MFEKLFNLKHHNTSIKNEFIAGLTTFLTMSYILAVNPTILSTTGMDKGAVFVATCLTCVLATAIMGFMANWPVALAPGMGLNAFFAYNVVANMGYSWQQALGIVFISGVVFVLLSITGARKWIIEGIPSSLCAAIAAGIGFFLALIALVSAGIIVKNPATIVGLGDVTKAPQLLALLGLVIIVSLHYFKIRGAILLGVLFITFLSYFVDPQPFHALLHSGPISMPPSLKPTLLKLDLLSVLHSGLWSILLVVVLMEMLNATGTLVGLGKQIGILKTDIVEDSGLGKAVLADSFAILVGSLLGTSSTTVFVESAAGVEAGGRTGLTAVAVAICFIFALFFWPLISVIPPYATAPALLFVACLMIKQFNFINWDDVTDSVPAALTALIMPLSYSIAIGIACGFIAYAVMKTFTGKWRQVHIATWVIAILFSLRFVYMHH